MSDGGDLFGYVGGGAGVTATVGFLAKFIWDSVQKRKEKLEEKAEENEEKAETRAEVKLDKLIESQARIELDMRDLRNGAAAQAGVVAAVDRRVEGLSQAYGPAIKNLELALARLEERLTERKPRR